MSIASLERKQGRPNEKPQPLGIPGEPRLWSPSLLQWALVLVAVGVAWRVLRYLLQFPIWGDEAFICLNFLDRGYLGLLQPLRYGQVAPVLFLWSELTAHHLLGGTELALRLLPLLAGLGALGLFWRLSRQTFVSLSGENAWLPATLAIGIFAVSYYPVRHSCEIKPYAFDLFLSLALMAPAVSWLRRPEQWGWLALLAAVAPVALAGSYPAVFVAGGVSAALLVPVWRCPSWKVRGCYLGYNLLMAAAFLGIYRLVGAGQYDSTGGIRNAYWSDWFPPRAPIALARWLVAAHTGNLFAYPLGCANGGSTATALLCVGGAVWLWRSGRRELVVLCTVPFALTFVAACLHRYPYGGSARVAQHLAPAICLLAGAGMAALITGLVSPLRRRFVSAAVCGSLALLGAAGMARDLTKPYKTEGDQQARQLVRDITSQAAAQDQIIVLESPQRIGPTFEWYLRREGDRIAWNGHLDRERLGTTGQVWCLCFKPRHRPAADDLANQLAKSGRQWNLASHENYQMQMGWTQDTIEHCEVFHWVRGR